MAHLFDPIDVGLLTLKNRIVMPPMAMDYATGEGEITDEVVGHYLERARGGVGLIITEHLFVSPEGRYSARQPGIYDDALLPGLERLAGTIVDEGVPLIAQISHAGARTTLEASVIQPVSPSGIKVPGVEAEPRELSVDEIIRIADAFTAAAARARKAGFTGVEIHGAHGFLLGQFASPITNHRTDEYGGSLENRMRLSIEIVRRVKAEIGDDMVLAYRLGADDMMDGGFALDDAGKVAQWLVDVGVQLMDVSGGLVGSRSADEGQGYFVPLATAVKSAITIPVIGVGKIIDPLFAESIIADERADMVAVGRAILKDPEWPKAAGVKLGVVG
ncbi:MAG: NADH:flavin oxidoreductase [Actinobacteria bacterium]|nr:NADH:flavin oxidoreductase [Actinomycetota bacterium]